MALLEYVDPETADEHVRDLLARDAETYDQPSLFARILAHAPAMLEARMAYAEAVMAGGDLDPKLKELAYVAVSAANDCPYCVASHTGHLVAHFDVPAARIDAITAGDLDGFDRRERAVITFAERVARDPKRVDADDLATLQEAGFDEAHVVELLTACAAAVGANTIADALSILPADQDDSVEDIDG